MTSVFAEYGVIVLSSAVPGVTASISLKNRFGRDCFFLAVQGNQKKANLQVPEVPNPALMFNPIKNPHHTGGDFIFPGKVWELDAVRLPGLCGLALTQRHAHTNQAHTKQCQGSRLRYSFGKVNATNCVSD